MLGLFLVTDTWIIVIGLAVGTFIIRLSGYVFGVFLPSTGRWVNILESLPGCLIASLLTVILHQSSANEWIAAVVAFLTAAVSKSLPLTMVAGVIAVLIMRYAT